MEAEFARVSRTCSLQEVQMPEENGDKDAKYTKKADLEEWTKNLCPPVEDEG